MNNSAPRKFLQVKKKLNSNFGVSNDSHIDPEANFSLIRNTMVRGSAYQSALVIPNLQILPAIAKAAKSAPNYMTHCTEKSIADKIVLDRFWITLFLENKQSQ